MKSLAEVIVELADLHARVPNVLTHPNTGDKDDRSFCRECGERKGWPCPTRKTLTGEGS